MFLEKLIQNLPGKPTFTVRRFEDINPLGGTRKIRALMMPNEAMTALHGRLIYYLRQLNIRSPIATCGFPGDSPKANVERHKENRFFYLLDIDDAYPSLSGNRLAKTLAELGFGNIGDVSDFLKRYCLTSQGGLATGAPASVDLFNLYAHFAIDVPLQKYCAAHGFTATRYLDDITISTPGGPRGPKRNPIGKCKRRVIRQIVNDAGFGISHEKSKVIDLKKGPVVITGIGLEFGGRMFLSKNFRRRANHILDNAVLDPLTNESRVSGIMGVIQSVKPYGYPLTRSERRTMDRYWVFRRQLAREKYLRGYR